MNFTNTEGGLGRGREGRRERGSERELAVVCFSHSPRTCCSPVGFQSKTLIPPPSLPPSLPLSHYTTLLTLPILIPLFPPSLPLPSLSAPPLLPFPSSPPSIPPPFPPSFSCLSPSNLYSCVHLARPSVCLALNCVC